MGRTGVAHDVDLWRYMHQPIEGKRRWSGGHRVPERAGSAKATGRALHAGCGRRSGAIRVHLEHAPPHGPIPQAAAMGGG